MAPDLLMQKLRAGTTTQGAANSLHAECYGTIGRLLEENARLKTYMRETMAEDIRKLNSQYNIVHDLAMHLIVKHERKTVPVAQEMVNDLVRIRLQPVTLEDEIPF